MFLRVKNCKICSKRVGNPPGNCELIHQHGFHRSSSEFTGVHRNPPGDWFHRSSPEFIGVHRSLKKMSEIGRFAPFCTFLFFAVFFALFRFLGGNRAFFKKQSIFFRKKLKFPRSRGFHAACAGWETATGSSRGPGRQRAKRLLGASIGPSVEWSCKVDVFSLHVALQ